MKEKKYLQALKEANDKKVNFDQLIKNVKQFAKKQYDHCAKKLSKEAESRGLPKEQAKLHIKRVCNNSIGLAIRSQKGRCKEIKGFMNPDRPKCQNVFNTMMLDYFKKGDKYDKIYKDKYKK